MAKDRTPSSLREGADRIAEQLRAAGYEAYFAGGCVRDALLGIKPKDYDIVTNARPEQVSKVFKRTFEVGASFGVVRVFLGKGFEYEIATYRTDGDYSDGRRPDAVAYSDSKEEDVKRRDFTINALLLDPQTDEIIDLVGGKKDLEFGRICAVGDAAARVGEDRLRMLRAVRFAARLGFEIEEKTFAAIKVHAPQINQVSVERIAVELGGIFSSSRPAHGLALLEETGLADHVLPPERPKTLSQVFLRLPKEAAACDKEDRIQIAWALTMQALDERALDERMRALKFSKEMMRGIAYLVRNTPKLLEPSDYQEADIVRIASAPQVEVTAAYQRTRLGKEHEAVVHFQKVRDALAENPLPKGPLVTGEDLKEMGMTPGPKFKEILNAVEIEVFERRLETREAALEFVKQNLI